MNLKKYIISSVLAIAGALIFTFLFWIFSLISWIIVFSILVVILIPVATSAINFYNDHHCCDFEDFWDELIDAIDEKKPPKDQNNRLL